VGRDLQLVEDGGDAGRAEQVDLDGGVEGGVEGDRRRGVDDDVAGGDERPAVVVEAEAVGAHVAGDGGDPAVHRGLEVVAPDLPEAVEGIVAEDLAVGPAGGVRAPPGADQEDELAARGRAQEAFDQRGAEEAGAPGDGDALAVEVRGDAHGRCVLPSGK
jgi:hypothetical protein